MVGGVCSGVAAYFDMDPLWLRLGFVAIVLLGGAGILLYIILWIVIPQARTTAEKLEMRGEEVNINNIKRNFEEEMDHLKKKMKNFENEAKAFGNSFRQGGERRDAAERFGDFLKDIFGGAFRIIGRIFAFFLVIACAGLIIALVGSLFGVTMVNNIALNHLSDFVFSGGQSTLAILGLLLAAGVPLLMLLYSGVRALLQIKQRNRIVTYTSTGLWIIGVIILMYAGYSIASDFSDRSHTTRQVSLVQPKCDTLFLRASRNANMNADDEGDWNIVSENGDKVMIRNPKLKIEPSDDDSFHLDVTAYARGFDNVDALNRAKRIRYEVVQKDSVLEFPVSYTIEKKDKWRAQDIRMTLYIPRDKMIFISKNMQNILYDVDNLSDTWDKNMVNRRWVMTAEGLACVDCDGLDTRHHGRKGKPAPVQVIVPIAPTGNKK
jgi:phage shock protein PspC (stress-responsive transcriptional regulator)